jgi:hypothetical protein
MAGSPSIVAGGGMASGSGGTPGDGVAGSAAGSAGTGGSLGGACAPALPDRLPGQIIVDPERQTQLVFHQDANCDGRYDPVLLAAPGDPEDFLYRSDRAAILDAMVAHGGNAMYLSIVRSGCLGGDGDSTEDPFQTHCDESSGLDEELLNDWDQLFASMGAQGISVYFIFYDDGVDPFGGSKVSDAERAFLTALVNRFEHHPRLIWCVAEEYPEGVGSRAPAIAAVIREADDYDHVIALHHATGDNTMDYPDDPSFDQFAQQPNSTSASALHADVLAAVEHAAGRFHVNMSENWNNGSNDHASAVKSGNRDEVRRRNWAAAMAGAHTMVVGTWHKKVGAVPSNDMLKDMRTLQAFFEGSRFNEMEAKDERKSAGTEWVLAGDGDLYILYSPSGATQGLGVTGSGTGSYDLTWVDAVSGVVVEQKAVSVSAAPAVFTKPSGFGNEVAVYARKQ